MRPSLFPTVPGERRDERRWVAVNRTAAPRHARPALSARSSAKTASVPAGPISGRTASPRGRQAGIQVPSLRFSPLPPGTLCGLDRRERNFRPYGPAAGAAWDWAPGRRLRRPRARTMWRLLSGARAPLLRATLSGQLSPVPQASPPRPPSGVWHRLRPPRGCRRASEPAAPFAPHAERLVQKRPRNVGSPPSPRPVLLGGRAPRVSQSGARGPQDSSVRSVRRRARQALGLSPSGFNLTFLCRFVGSAARQCRPEDAAPGANV